MHYLYKIVIDSTFAILLLLFINYESIIYFTFVLYFLSFFIFLTIYHKMLLI